MKAGAEARAKPIKCQTSTWNPNIKPKRA